MSDTTNIEWTDSTFNPWMGCTKISPACDHCYAERDTKRFGRVQWGAGQPRVRTSAGNWKKPLQWNRADFRACGDCGWRGEVDTLVSDECPSCGKHERLEPARRRVFCASLADVFDNEVDPQWRADLFALIAQTPNLDWLLLTKRIGNVPAMLRQILRLNGLPPNVWLGATICNQDEADRDIHKLLSVPAAVRFLSIEPMLGPIQLPFDRIGHWNALAIQSNQPWATTRLHWVICGGESGPNARPMHPAWARLLRDQCAEANVPFLFKQWGEWADANDWPSEIQEDHDVRGLTDGMSIRVGKKAAGRLLDGVQHDGYPKGGAA